MNPLGEFLEEKNTGIWYWFVCKNNHYVWSFNQEWLYL